MSIPSLDGIRGFAILLVLIEHFSSAKILPVEGLKGIGKTGVYLFFSLSAFLLVSPFWWKNPETLWRWKTWAEYFWRRFLRIYPLFTIVLLVKWWFNVGKSPTEPGDFTWLTVINHLLLRKGEDVLWTMPVELKYYLILPLLIMVFVVAWRRSVIIGMSSTIGLSAFLVLVFFRFESRTWSLDGHVLKDYFYIFLLGSVAGSFHAYFSRHPIESKIAKVTLELIAELCIAAVVCLFHPGAYGFTKATADTVFNNHRVTNPFFGCLCGLFIFGQLHGLGILRRVLSWPPFRYLGSISYSIYLWHIPLMTLVWSWHLHWSWPWRVSVEVLVILVVATLSYHLIERPSSRFKRIFRSKETLWLPIAAMDEASI